MKVFIHAQNVVVDKDPEVARRLVVIGAARLPQDGDAEFHAEPVAAAKPDKDEEKAPKSRRGRK